MGDFCFQISALHQPHNWRSSERNWIASEIWSLLIFSAPARSARSSAPLSISGRRHAGTEVVFRHGLPEQIARPVRRVHRRFSGSRDPMRALQVICFFASEPGVPASGRQSRARGFAPRVHRVARRTFRGISPAAPRCAGQCDPAAARKSGPDNSESRGANFLIRPASFRPARRIHRGDQHAGLRGKVIVPSGARNRDLSLPPVGWRIVSKTLRLNSGNSSRNKTPLWASEISPGVGIDVAAQQTGIARGMMRRAEGPLRDERLAQISTGRRCCGSWLFPMLHPGSAAAKSWPAAWPAWICRCRAGRLKGIVVTARRREFQGAFYILLSLHFGKIVFVRGLVVFEK